MHIKMLETRRGTEDGFTIHQFIRDQEYDVAETLAHAFLAAGFAVPVKAKQKAKKDEAKKSSPRHGPKLVKNN